MKGGQIKIYIINLKRSVDRKEEMIRKLDLLNLKYEFFEGVDGNSLSTNVLQEIKSQPYSFKNSFGREMTLGEIGCAISHLNLYQKIVNDKMENALILEDDIDFFNSLQYVVTSNKAREVLSKNYDLILLGYSADGNDYRRVGEISCFRKHRIGENILFGTPTSWNWSTIGYLISYSGALKLLTQGKLPRMPSDFLTANSPKYGVNLGIVNKPILWPGFLNNFSEVGLGRGHSEELYHFEESKAEPSNKLKENVYCFKRYYRIFRMKYIWLKKMIFRKVIKLIPYHYLYVSDKF